jgi:hypothetical protein
MEALNWPPKAAQEFVNRGLYEARMSSPFGNIDVRRTPKNNLKNISVDIPVGGSTFGQLFLSAALQPEADALHYLTTAIIVGVQRASRGVVIQETDPPTGLQIASSCEVADEALTSQPGSSTEVYRVPIAFVRNAPAQQPE